MTPVVKTFLLVSAAYLSGGIPAALADRDGEGLAGRGLDGYAVEESVGEEQRTVAARADPIQPLLDED
jgi:hypothetical protein